MDNEVIKYIKSLGIDMIDKSGAGHPGIVLAAAPIIYTLYANFMNVNPLDPNWINRDRFIMSCGHGSALLYSMLFYAGYNITLEDIMNYRSINNNTPGHPEVNLTSGVDASSGPLGEGLATAVGIAYGEKYLNKYFKDKYTYPLIDYNTYVLVSDGDLMEGISYEAMSFAGCNKLNKLIVLYDSNNVTLDGPLKKSFSEDVIMRFKSMGFYTQVVLDGNNLEELNKAIRNAKMNKISPSFIEVRTVIGQGSMYEGTNIVHGKPLSKEDINNVKTSLNVSKQPFFIEENLKDILTNKIRKRFQEKYLNWIELKNKTIKDNNIFNFQINFDNYQFNNNENELRDINNKIINYIANQNDFFLGGSADLASSCKTIINEENSLRNIAFGVRENAMGAICNGLALSGLQPFCSTFLVFSDYLRPSIRMSALMNLNVVYIFTHESIIIGSDGPTHQPIEQLNSLRITPNLTLIKPYDEKELIGAWKYIINNHGPKALVVSKVAPCSNICGQEDIKNGAYIISEAKGNLDGVIIATGYEVGIALNVQKLLENNQIYVRVVSMPSIELFNQSDGLYKTQLLPPIAKKFVIEMGESSIWHRFVVHEKYLFNINEFGKSGSKEELLNNFGYIETEIKNKIINILDKY